MSIKRRQPVRDRIIQTASQLFYRQGYQATGINEIIEKAGVAKASFYSQFPSKGDLCLAYLQQKNEDEIQLVNDWIAKRSSPRSRFLSMIDQLESWLASTDYKGCGFLNIVPEVTDHKDPIRMESKAHYERLKDIFRQLSKELIKSDPQRYKHLNAEILAQDYLSVVAGAIALSEIYHDPKPIRHARHMMERMIS